METYAIKNLSFRYTEKGIDVLKDITFSVNEGEFITVCGPSGCGKSTLLRHLKPDLSPHGVLSGEIFFEEKPISDLSHREQSSKIGFVMHHQFCFSDRTADERHDEYNHGCTAEPWA